MISRKSLHRMKNKSTTQECLSKKSIVMLKSCVLLVYHWYSHIVDAVSRWSLLRCFTPSVRMAQGWPGLSDRIHLNHSCFFTIVEDNLIVVLSFLRFSRPPKETFFSFFGGYLIIIWWKVFLERNSDNLLMQQNHL